MLNEHNQRLNHYFSLMFPVQFENYEEGIQKVFQ